MLKWKNNRIVFSDWEDEEAILEGELQVAYTLKSEDITKQSPPDAAAYIGRREAFSGYGYAPLTKTSVFVEEVDAGLDILLRTESRELSAFGVYLPFNFMGKLGGGGWRNQYLLNSPYSSEDNRYIYCYLSNPNGRNLMLVMESPMDGWKMDYSEYCGGHFFYSLELLANFDRAYRTGSSRREVRFRIFCCRDFRQGLAMAQELLQVPVAYYGQNVGFLGKTLEIEVLGQCEYLLADGIRYTPRNGRCHIPLTREGLIAICPYHDGTPGLECVVYGCRNLDELWRRSMDSVTEADLRQTDGNLCEHQCWASAMLRYMLRYGRVERYESMVKGLLDIITETEEEQAKIYHDITIFDKEQENGLPAWHIYGSRRIQEQFFGIGILLDAYRYFQEEKYLVYAVNALDTALEHYQTEKGSLEIYSAYHGRYCDYSTVCCLMIPVVDMALFFENKDDGLYQKYRQASSRLAEYLYARQWNFPTETDDTDQAEEEMEDGSISCTALSLLYYSAKIQRKEVYVQFALEILEVHESWIMQTPVAPMYRSTLRWWETRWEGDKDGPALCCGHAWTIWRAEADYWAYILTGEEKYLRQAKSSFGSNFSKIGKHGESYAIYQADYITGGGFHHQLPVRYEIVPKFPRQTDSGLSRYVWSRAAETILNDGKK